MNATCYNPMYAYTQVSNASARHPDFKVSAKRSQHIGATYRSIVGRNMLYAFGHRVAMCCDKLGLVSSNLTIFKLEPTTPNMS